MRQKEFDDLRKRIFSDVEEEEEPDVEKVTFEDLFNAQEVRPLREAPAPRPPEPVEEDKPQTEEDRTVLNLRQIKRLISAYRYRLAEAERRVGELRMKVAGLETEYRAIVGEPAPPPQREPAPAPPRRTPDPPAQPAPKRTRKPTAALWEDAGEIGLEEAARRILIEQGKSMPLWRIASAIRRKGYSKEVSESALDAEIKKSDRLGFTGLGHVYIK